jgi:diguanylate cyclase (GGDEF)-like protein
MENEGVIRGGSAEAEDDIRRRAQLITWFTGLLALVIGFATVFRPLLASHDPMFTVAGVFNTGVTAFAWWWFRSGRTQRHAPTILIVLATAMILPLILVSGGPMSQFTSAVPLFPIFGVLLGGRRLAASSLAFWIAVLPMTYFLGDAVPDLTGEIWHPDKAASRTFWLIMASVIAMAFALEFDKRTRELQEKLRYLAERDPLTGIANRRGMDRALQRVLALTRRTDRWTTLMIVDADHFKRYNDERGHAEGDAALQRIARVLEDQTRAGQDTVARFGGEEFVAILWDTDPEEAAVVGEKIRLAVRGLGLRFNDESAQVLTVTIGAASTRGVDPACADELLRRADSALYEGKLRGRDRLIRGAELHGEAPAASAVRY